LISAENESGHTIQNLKVKIQKSNQGLPNTLHGFCSRNYIVALGPRHELIPISNEEIYTQKPQRDAVDAKD